MAVKSKYEVCPKCLVRYSTLTKHKCFVPEEQKDKPEFEDPPEEDGDGEGKGGGTPDDKDAEGEADGEGQKGDKSEGDSEGEGDGEGEEGEGEDEAEGEGPKPQPPEPDAPPVAIVCTVLKFAALTAQCAKNGVITVELTEDGLFVYGYNGDLTSSASLPWGEFEKRSTIDGEFYVKEVIDGVDNEIGGAEVPMIEQAKRAMAKVKTERAKVPKAEPKPPEPEAVPVWPAEGVLLKAGDEVKLRNGTVHSLVPYDTSEPDREDNKHKVRICHGWLHADSGRWGGAAGEHAHDIVELVSEGRKSPKKAEQGLTLPLTVGQRVVLRNGTLATFEREDAEDGDIRHQHGWVHKTDGLWLGGGGDHECDAVADADGWKAEKPTLTLPLTVGQKVVTGKGDTVTVTHVNDNGYASYSDGCSTHAGTGNSDFDDGIHGAGYFGGGGRNYYAISDAPDWKPPHPERELIKDWSKIEFMNGKEAYNWPYEQSKAEHGGRVVGVPSGGGSFDNHKVADAAKIEKLGLRNGYQIEVDPWGFAIKDKTLTVQVVRNRD